MPWYKQNRKGYYAEGFKGPKITCEKCGLWYYEQEDGERQNGKWYCYENCLDELNTKAVSSVNHTG